MALLRVPGASWWSTPSPRIAARWHAGLRVAYTGAGKTQLLVPPVRATGTDLKAFAQTEYGPALWTNDTATGAGLLLPGVGRLTQTDNITIFALTKEPARTAAGAAYSQRDTGAGSTIELSLNRSNAGSLVAGTAALYIRSTSALNRGGRIDSVLDGEWHGIAIAHTTSSTYRFSVDGAIPPSTSSIAPTGTVLTGTESPMIGGRAGVAEGAIGPLALVFVWQRALSQAELDEITGDPSVLFEEDALWVPTSAGGGGPTNLTGESSTISPGALIADRVISLSGSAISASAGTITYSGDASLNISLSGAAVTVSPGTLAFLQELALSGSSVSGEAGSVSPGVSLPLAGQSLSAEAGTVTYSADGSISLTLSGQSVTVSPGDLGSSRSKALSGASVTVSGGTLSVLSGSALITVRAGSWIRYIKLPTA